ncbi:hypothetical protein LX64_04163 [Chitinophaga skermanii]|uniref:Uncharacterized protein n=1 Tax=Chitinophaga skermanii TaxID=331697 RepID=A0A327QFJ8_9BACT|nr:hypothetical protein [Chitinophaga skermanii]RAJ00457.1 hypothetical protein LX64_04163 [Chitinophaga skermanii]
MQLSQRQYAKEIGVSNEAVRRAIKDGKIVKGWDAATKKIIPEIANAEWGYIHNAASTDNHVNDTPKKGLTLDSDSSYNDAKRVKEILSAQLIALELKEKKEELVNKAAVYQELFKFGQQIRTAFLNIPDRTIDNIIAAETRSEAHAILTNAIHEVLEKLTSIAK